MSHNRRCAKARVARIGLPARTPKPMLARPMLLQQWHAFAPCPTHAIGARWPPSGKVAKTGYLTYQQCGSRYLTRRGSGTWTPPLPHEPDDAGLAWHLGGAPTEHSHCAYKVAHCLACAKRSCMPRVRRHGGQGGYLLCILPTLSKRPQPISYIVTATLCSQLH